MALIAAEVLDGTYGKVAEAVSVRLERASGREWSTVGSGAPGSDGRIGEWAYRSFQPGLYRLTLSSARYFASLGMSTLFPEVQIIFRAAGDHGFCQVQVILSPYSYTANITVAPARPAPGPG